MIKLIQSRYSKVSESALDTGDIIDSLQTAIVHVEAIDFQTGNSYSIENDLIVFAQEPSDKVGMLYVLKALINILEADMNSKVSNNKLGVSWRSGMDSVNSSGAAKAASDLINSIQTEYDDALKKAKISNLGMTNIPLY